MISSKTSKELFGSALGLEMEACGRQTCRQSMDDRARRHGGHTVGTTGCLHGSCAERLGYTHIYIYIYIYSADVSQAFLKGLSFEEAAKLKGETLRSIQFDVLPGSVRILCMLDDYSDFDGVTEVLDMLRGGLGLNDAPRLWNHVFSAVLTSLSYMPCKFGLEVM